MIVTFVAQLLHLGEDVAGEQHSGTAVGYLFDHRSENAFLHQRVQA